MIITLHTESAIPVQVIWQLLVWNLNRNIKYVGILMRRLSR